MLKKNGPQAIGKSRGGWNTKIHLVAADARTAITFSLSLGQAHDAPEGRELLKRLGPPSRPLQLIMDRAYEGNETRQLALDLGFIPVVPPLSTRIEPWEYDRAMYKRRNEVERLFRWLKGSFQFNPVGTSAFTQSCDIAKSFLAKASVTYRNEAAPPGTTAGVRIGDTVITSFEGKGLPPAELKAKAAEFSQAMGKVIKSVGYPASADKGQIHYPMVMLILTALVTLVALDYAPIAAILVELFPTQIRYTAMSLPYHIGNGWFGGFLPTTAFALVAATGDIYYGLWYPIVIAAISFVVALVFLPETKDRSIDN